MNMKNTTKHKTKVSNKGDAKVLRKAKKHQLSIYLEKVTTIHLDPQQTIRVYIVAGELGGEKFQAQLTESEFDKMNFGTKLFGEKLFLTLCVKLRSVEIIELLKDVKEYKETHLYRYQGYSTINGERVYLSSNGVFNKNGLIDDHNVEIATGYLGKPEYSAIPKKREGRIKLVELTLELFDPKENCFVGVTMFAPAARAALTHFLPSKVSYFNLGETGAWKSVFSAAAQSALLPGTTEESLPLNFQSTTKGMRLLSAGFNNSLLVIDDYNTEKVDEELIELLTIGNSQSTGRHTAKSATELDQPVKTNNVNIITGEVAFNTDKDSRHFRIVYLEFIPNIISSAELSEIQRRASEGVYYQTMMLFIQWILSNHESLEETVKDKYELMRVRATKDLPQGTHLRLCENAADFFLGIYFFTQFCAHKRSPANNIEGVA